MLHFFVLSSYVTFYVTLMIMASKIPFQGTSLEMWRCFYVAMNGLPLGTLVLEVGLHNRPRDSMRICIRGTWFDPTATNLSTGSF